MIQKVFIEIFKNPKLFSLNFHLFFTANDFIFTKPLGHPSTICH